MAKDARNLKMARKHPGLAQAIIAAGGVLRLAGRLKVSRQTISAWGRKGIPLGRVAAVEKASGIPRQILRPDCYGPSSPAV